MHTSYICTTSWWPCVLLSSFSIVTHTLLMNLIATNVAMATNAEQTNMMLLYSVDSILLHPNSSRLSGDTSLHKRAWRHTHCGIVQDCALCADTTQYIRGCIGHAVWQYGDAWESCVHRTTLVVHMQVISIHTTHS